MKLQTSNNASFIPAVTATIQWNPETGSLELYRTEIGILGRSVWLIHEGYQDDEDSGLLGIQLKKTF